MSDFILTTLNILLQKFEMMEIFLLKSKIHILLIEEHLVTLTTRNIDFGQGQKDCHKS